MTDHEEQIICRLCGQPIPYGSTVVATSSHGWRHGDTAICRENIKVRSEGDK